MTPLAISPPSSTPEPDMSSIPQDAATIPHSATPQVLTGRPRSSSTALLHQRGFPDVIKPADLHPPSLHLHQQAGKHRTQPGPQEDPAAPGSLWTRPALSGSPAGCPGLHRQRLPAENCLHPADTRLRRRKDIRCCTETSLRCCFLLCNSICARVRLRGFKVDPPVWIFQPRSMGSSTFSACLW